MSEAFWTYALGIVLGRQLEAVRKPTPAGASQSWKVRRWSWSGHGHPSGAGSRSTVSGPTTATTPGATSSARSRIAPQARLSGGIRDRQIGAELPALDQA
jgi:hypothetical protein